MVVNPNFKTGHNFATHRASKFQNKPCMKLWRWIERILKYLAKYPNIGLTFKRPTTKTPCYRVLLMLPSQPKRIHRRGLDGSTSSTEQTSLGIRRTRAVLSLHQPK